MIDVPVEVKDALRAGNTKKVDRFEVLKEVDQRDAIGTLATLTSNNNSYTFTFPGAYILYNLNNRHAFDYLEIVGASASAEICPVGEVETWLKIWADTGDVLTIYGFNAAAVYITRPELITYKRAWAYDFTIANDTLVSESVSYDERMCSGDKLKYGLCEGSSLEFQYFNHPNITGQRVQAFIDVNYNDITKSIYSDVKKQYTNIRQSSGGYSWHSSDYTLPSDGVYKVYVSEHLAYFGDVLVTVGGVQRAVSAETFSDGHKECYLGELETGAKVMLRSNSPACTAMLRIKTGETIPMGFFDVKKCSRQASTSIIKVTAYNKLQSEYLDAKANNLVVDAFDDKGSIVTIYDIKRIALNKYSIDPAEINTILPHTTGSLTPLDDGVSGTKWNVFVRDNGPISLFDFGFYSLPSSVKFAFAGDDMCIYTLDPNKYYRIDCEYNLDDYEKSFLSYLMEVVEKANLNVNSYDYLMSCIRNMYLPSSPNTYKTWKFFFSIELTDRNGNKEYYSIVCKENGVSVNGTMNDLKLRLIHGYTEMHVYTPRAMGAYTNNILDITTKSFSFAGDSDGSGKITYHYNDTQYTTATNQYPAFKKPNGMPFSNGWVNPLEFLSLVEVSGLSNADLITVKVNEMPDYTLRNLVDATFETVCQFGQLDRVTDLFAGVELNRSRLYPAEALYPSDTLYPSGAAASGFKSMYSKLWADEGNIHKWRYLIITYKGLNGDSQEEDYTLQRTVNADGTDDYNMSDNWIFKNLVWTAEQVGAYADAMVLKMRDITWFPFEMWCAGLPYLETGDEIEIPLGEETYTSYILQRQLKGIQNLQDTYINGTLDIF